MKAQPTVLLLAETGPSGFVATIECSPNNSLLNMVIVGFVSKAVDEARERIRSAFAVSSLTLPRKRITINLAPAAERFGLSAPHIAEALQYRPHAYREL